MYALTFAPHNLFQVSPFIKVEDWTVVLFHSFISHHLVFPRYLMPLLAQAVCTENGSHPEIQVLRLMVNPCLVVVRTPVSQAILPVESPGPTVLVGPHLVSWSGCRFMGWGVWIPHELGLKRRRYTDIPLWTKIGSSSSPAEH